MVNLSKDIITNEFKLLNGSCLERIKELPDNSVDSIVTDPPYELGFMGKSWDSTGIAFNLNVWKECLRVLKPGGHLIAFSGSRTYHRMAVAIEDAGFEIRDQIMWVYGSGFPKSLDVSKAIDKKFGAEREVVGSKKSGIGSGKTFGMLQNGENKTSEVDITAPSTEQAKQWNGWGTALKPSHEPMVLARKPLSEKTVAENVLKWGVGALNIDGCRVGNEVRINQPASSAGEVMKTGLKNNVDVKEVIGRWPANFIHDGLETEWAKFFYCPKASKKDRNDGLDGFELKQSPMLSGQVTKDGKEHEFGGFKSLNQNNHPTVKPTDLMAYLVRLVTQPNGTVLDPFNGSGSTGKACIRENFKYIGIDLSYNYLKISDARIKNEFNKKEK